MAGEAVAFPAMPADGAMLNPIFLAFAVPASLALLTPPPALAADDGASIFAQACALCHTPTRRSLDKKRLTRHEWEAATERMIGYGAQVPKAKLPELLNYLVRSHGPASGPPAKK